MLVDCNDRESVLRIVRGVVEGRGLLHQTIYGGHPATVEPDALALVCETDLINGHPQPVLAVYSQPDKPPQRYKAIGLPLIIDRCTLEMWVDRVLDDLLGQPPP
jgi:hypothetical protein